MRLKKAAFNIWIRCYLYNNKYILYLRRKGKCSNKKWLYNLILGISLPYIVLRWGVLVVYENIFGKKRIFCDMKRERNKSFMYEMAMVAIAKNEGPYIREWIEHHKLIGFTKFYLYDNESDDDTRLLLSPYIESGLVEYTFFPGKMRQLDAYNDAIERHKNECRWMAFLDVDEFIMPTVPFKPITEIVSDIVYNSGKGAVGLGINWVVYGSSNFKEKPQGFVMDNFLHRSEKTHWSCFMVKTICNPRMVAYYISPHYPLYKTGGYSVSESDGKRQYGWFHHNVTYKNVRINHYFTKSRQEYVKKRNRGLADRLGQYDMAMFDKYDLNDIYDESMKVYSEKIKKNLGIC